MWDLFSIPLKNESGELLIGDLLASNFWCPTTQYSRKNRPYIKGLRYHIKAIITTAIARLIPLEVTRKLKKKIKVKLINFLKW